MKKQIKPRISLSQEDLEQNNPVPRGWSQDNITGFGDEADDTSVMFSFHTNYSHQKEETL